MVRKFFNFLKVEFDTNSCILLLFYMYNIHIFHMWQYFMVSTLFALPPFPQYIFLWNLPLDG